MIYNLFVCKSISLANFLISHGSIILRIDKDIKSSNHLVFLFKKDQLLEDNLKKWNK